MRKRIFLSVIIALGFTLSLNAAINININSGNPTIPFPQFYNYTPSTLTYTVYSLSDPAHTATGIALHQPDGLSLDEMEKWMRESWKIHSNEFYYADTLQNPSLAGDVKTGPYQNATGGAANVRLIWEDSSPACSEGHGYALLGAALMCDKDAFDGLWCYLNENGYFSNTRRYSTGAMFPAVSWGRHVPAWSTPLSAGTADSATDGDDDIAMAALLAWRQWGDNTGYYAPGGTGPVNSSGQPAIQYRQMALDMMRFMVEKYLDSNNKYLSGDIGYDGYHKGGNTWNETTNWYTGPDPLEKSGPQIDGWFDYAAPGYFHSFGTVLQGLGDPAWNYNQFFRGEASDDWLMGQLATNPIYKNITAGQYSVTGSTATFKNNNIGGEDFRAPMRTIINYLWHGNPTNSWDPATHSIVAGSNQHEFNAAVKQSNFMSDPQTYGTGVGCENYGGPVTFRGPSSLQVYNLDGTLKDHNWHIVYELAGPGAASSVAAQNFELMGALFRDIMVQWDHAGGADFYLNSIPHYFHGFFRQWGLMVLTGNLLDPCHWDPKPNMRVFKAMDKTYTFPGETLKFWINYRNYGSVDATGVKIVDTLPAAFEYVSATDFGGSTHGAAGQVVTWNIPTVTGLHNQNYTATQGGVTLTVRVRDNAAEGRYCNFADISCTNGTGSTSSPFPNNVSTIMCRTCVDIVSAALVITKTASTATAGVGDTITYTVNFCNSAAAAGWINGGRSGVNFSFGVNTLPGTASTSINFHLRANHAATEPAVDWANYRLSYFLNSPYNTWALNFMTAEGFNGATTTISYEPFSACMPTACSDATGSWNQRFMLQFGNFGASVAAPTHMLFWKASGTCPNNFIHIGTQGYPFRGQFEITAGWNPQDWTDDWSQQDAWAVQTQDQALFPISPDWTRGDGTSTIVTKINKDACQTATNQVTNVLIEEWDGYTWRRVFGNGPMPGREITGVVLTDSLPACLNFGGFITPTASAALTWDSGTRTIRWNVGNMQINQCGTLQYWVTAGSCPCTSNNIAFVKGDKEAPVSDNAVVNITCSGTTPTFTPSRTRTSTASPTPSRTASPSPSASGTPTRTPSATVSVSPSASYTRTPTRTASPSPSPTGSGTVSFTPTMTGTPTLSRTPTGSASFTPTATLTRTPTSTPSLTPSPSATGSPSFTRTPSPTATLTRSPTPTFSITDTISSNTATFTPSITATPTGTQSYTATGTATPTVTLTATRTNTTSPTGTPTASPTSSLSSTRTYTLTVTFTPTPSDTVTLTPTPSITDTLSSNTPTVTRTSSDTPTHTPTASGTPTGTPTRTATNTATESHTASPAASPTITPTATGTRTVTRTATETATFTETRSPTYTPTATRTATETATPTVTRTDTPTPTDTRTMTDTPTFTNTQTETSTPTETPTITATASITPTPLPSPSDIDITLKAEGPIKPKVGDTVVLTITLTNDTESPVYGIAVRALLPVEVAYLGTDFLDAPVSITPTASGTTLAWDITYKLGQTDPFILEPGQSETITFSVKIIAATVNNDPIRITAETDYMDGYYFTGSPNGDRHPPLSTGDFFYPLGRIVVYPNPYNPMNGDLKFVNVVPGSTIQIWTLSGEFVRTIYAPTYRAFWDGRNHKAAEVSAGIYLFTIRNGTSPMPLKGKIFVIKQ